MNTSLSNLVARARDTEPIDTVMEGSEHMPMADASCKGCGVCASNCPTGAISVDDGWRVDLGRCLFCMDCAMVCPDNCIGEAIAPDYALSREELVVDRGTDVASLERRLDPKVSRMFGRSLAIRELDTGSCNACEVDLGCMSNRFYDMHRFGIKVVASPRHADVLLVTGPVCNNMCEAVERTYGAVPEPKLVVASGTCAISGGIFVGGDVREGGIGSMLEPAVFIPGCPPTPDRVIRALVKSIGLHH